MNSKILKSGHIKLYKRENSKFWQMKIKLPKQKSIRSSSGTKILKEAEKIALNNYSLLNKENKIKIKKTLNNIFKKMHLVETADLNKKEIHFRIRILKTIIRSNLMFS